MSEFTLATIGSADIGTSAAGVARYVQRFVVIPVAVLCGVVLAAAVQGAVGAWQVLTGTGASFPGQNVPAVGTFGAQDVMAISTVVEYGIVTAVGPAVVPSLPVTQARNKQRLRTDARRTTMTPQATRATYRETFRVGAISHDGSRPNGWYAETLRDDDALTRLAPEWDGLYERCSTATAFLSSAWLDSWWRSYGKPGRLVVVTVRNGSRLVAGAALMRSYPLGLPLLRPIGVGISDFSDVLLDDGCAQEAAGHLAQELARWRAYTVDFPEVPEDAALWHVAAARTHRIWRVPGSTCLFLPARPLDELIDGLPPRSARRRRNKDRKIQEARITTRTVDAHDAPGAVTTLLALHREQWRGRGMNPEHGRPRFAAHLRQAVPAMVQRGQAVVLEHADQGRAVAVGLMVGGKRTMGAYLYGHEPDLRKRMDVTQLMLRGNLDVALHHGASTLSLLRGDEPHKRDWHPQVRHNARLLLACPRVLPATAYAFGVGVRSRLAIFVKSRSPRVTATVRTVRRWFPFST